MSSRSTLWLLAVLSAAVMSWLLTRTPERGATTSPPAEGPLQYYLKDATVLGTSETGAVIYRVHAAEATRATNSAVTQLSEVQLQFTPASSVAWRISSRKALIREDRPDIEFSGDVRIMTTGPEQATPAAVHTDRLRVDPRRRTAATSDPVSLFIGDSELSATGMKADLQASRVQLESNVHGKYVQ